jgi:hypothetical protein
MPTINDVNGPLGSVEAADAERAIRRAILLYCKGIDTCDADTVMEAFHADATTDYGAAQGKCFVEMAYSRNVEVARVRHLDKTLSRGLPHHVHLCNDGRGRDADRRVASLQQRTR